MVRKKETSSDHIPQRSLRTKAVESVISTFGIDRQTTINAITNIISARDIAVDPLTKTALNRAILDITDRYAQFWQDRHPPGEGCDVWDDPAHASECFDAQDIFCTLRKPSREALGVLYLSHPLTEKRYQATRTYLEKLIFFGKLFRIDDGKDVRNLFLVKYIRALRLPPNQSLALLAEALQEYRQIDPRKYLQPTNGRPDFYRRLPFVDSKNNLSVAEIVAASNSILTESYPEATAFLAQARESLAKSINALSQPSDHSGLEYDQRLVTAYANQILLNLTQTHLSLATGESVQQSHIDAIYNGFIQATQLIKTTQSNTGYVEDLSEYILPALTTRFLHALHLLQHVSQFSPDRFIILAKELNISGDTIPELILSTTTQTKLHIDAEDVAERKHLSYIIKNLFRLDSRQTSGRVDLD